MWIADPDERLFPCCSEQYSSVKRILDPLLTYTHTRSCAGPCILLTQHPGLAEVELVQPNSPMSQTDSTAVCILQDLHRNRKLPLCFTQAWRQVDFLCWLDSRSQSKLLYHSGRQGSKNTSISWAFHRVTAPFRRPPALL